MTHLGPEMIVAKSDGGTALSGVLALHRVRLGVTTEAMPRRDVTALPSGKHLEIKAQGRKIGKAEQPSPDFDDVGGHGQIPLFAWLVLTE